MGIVNNYDMTVVMDGSQEAAIKEILRDRDFALLEMETVLDDKIIISINGITKRPLIENVEKLGIREKGANTTRKECGTFLIIDHKGTDAINELINKTETEKDINITRISKDELLSYLEKKELLFQTDDLQTSGNVEHFINKRFMENIFHVYNDEQKLSYYEFLDVRFFLQRLKDDGEDTSSRIQPEDIRSFDLNEGYLSYLKDESRERYIEGQNDFDVEYAMISDELQAQYLLARFHYDPEDDNSVCVYCFRLSAFILPGISSVKTDELADDQIATNVSTGEDYRIDSIHFNSDILYDCEELDNLIYDHYFEIDGRPLEE